MFQAFKMNKKMVLYAEDYEEYRKNERDIYFELDELPSQMVHNEKELINAINNFSIPDYESKLKFFNLKIGYYEEDASYLCAKLIRSRVME